MGYVESAPLFCATAKNNANFANHDDKCCHLHPLDDIAATLLALPDPEVVSVLTSPQEIRLVDHLAALPDAVTQSCLSYVYVYVDDLILLQQGHPEQRQLHIATCSTTLTGCSSPLMPTTPRAQRSTP